MSPLAHVSCFRTLLSSSTSVQRFQINIHVSFNFTLHLFSLYSTGKNIVSWFACGGQRTTCRSQVPPPICILWIELRSNSFVSKHLHLLVHPNTPNAHTFSQILSVVSNFTFKHPTNLKICYWVLYYKRKKTFPSQIRPNLIDRIIRLFLRLNRNLRDS